MPPEMGEGESLAAAARALGLWDGVTWARKAQSDYEFATARKVKLTDIADGYLDSNDPDLVEVGLKAEQVSAKWGDTAAKLEKLAKQAVDLFERMAAKEKRDRLLKSLGGGN